MGLLEHPAITRCLRTGYPYENLDEPEEVEVTLEDAVQYAEDMDTASFFALMLEYVREGSSLDDMLSEWMEPRMEEIKEWMS